MGRLLLLAASAVTIYATTHAGLLWLLLWTVTTAAVTAKTTSKAQGTEARVNKIVGSLGTTISGVNTRVSNLSGQLTGAEDVTGTSTTSTDGLPNGGITGTSGSASAGTAHTHGAGSYAVTDGQHSHTYNDAHDHQLPVV